MLNLRGLVTVQAEDGLHANSYAIRTSNGLAVIDPSHTPEAMAGGDRDLVQVLLATHGHYDHTSGTLDWLARNPALAYYMQSNDKVMSRDPSRNASVLFGRPQKTAEPTHFFHEEETVSLGDRMHLSVLHTPGHTAGSVCLVLEEVLPNGLRKALAIFTGDTVFTTSIGRHDLPGGSETALLASLRKLVNFGRKYTFFSDMPVYSGHGRVSSWAELLHLNPWLRQAMR